MSWTDDQLQRLRDRLAQAKRQGAWLSAGEAGIVLGLIRFWNRSTKLSGHDGPARGRLPTIADSRAQGVAGVFVERARIGCGNRRRLSWEDLGLPEQTVFVDITGCRRFRCYRCGGQRVTISADWPDPRMGSGGSGPDRSGK